jgi:23S rRNA pseudouridine1911/1915/1917 synthase
MFALSSKAAARLSEQMRSRRIEKVYLAVVEGRPEPRAVLQAHLLKDKEANLTTVVSAGTGGAKACELSYRCLAVLGGRALLEVRPKTGRSHQIRVQLADAGLPIYGDVKYGASQAWDGQIALHALSVEFSHPVAKTPVSVKAPVPAVWSQIWAGDLDV